MTPFSEPSFYQGDRHTYRRVAVVGSLFCLAFVVISFSLDRVGGETVATLVLAAQ